MDVAGIGPGIVSRLYEAGFDSIPKILAMEESDFLKVEGIKQKMASKLHGNIAKQITDKSDTKTLAKLMAGSNIFQRGVGERKIMAIFKIYPNILITKEDAETKINMLVNGVEGFAVKTATQFVENIPEFLKWMEVANMEDKLYDVSEMTKKTSEKTDTESQVIMSPLNEQSIVLTGFRNKELETTLEETYGAKISGSVSRKTFTVVVPSMDTDTGKAEKARELGIPLITEKDFRSKYL